MKYIEVGSKKEVKKIDGKKLIYLWTYNDVPQAKSGWVVDLKYRPHPFDICHLEIGNRDITLNGWWTGLEWYGLRMKKTDQVKAWKLNKEFM